MIAGLIAASISMTAYAATAQDIIAKNQGSYTAGTQSIYGPKLTQEQLNAVANVVSDFATNYVNSSMSNDDKIRAGYNYIKNNITYIDWRESTYANTAYGALVEKKAACSGMTRAFVALMDAVDIKAYWIHAADNSHQWNIVEFNDGFYHIDIDANIASGFEAIYKSSTHPYAYDTATYPAIGTHSAEYGSGTQTVNNGWKEESGKWYYYENGNKAISKWIDGLYYVGPDGAMLVNTTTPDGYQVGADGAWIQTADSSKNITDTNSKSLISWIVPSNTDGLERADDWRDFRWRWKDDNGNYYKNCWVNYVGSNCWLYLDADGYSLIEADTPDGYHVDSNGVYYVPQYSENGKRTLQAGDKIFDNTDVLEKRVDTNGNTYYLLAATTTTVSFKDNSEIDAGFLSIDFTAYKYNSNTNTIYPFSNDGTAIYEDFQFEKEYDLKIPNTDLRGAALVEYCKQNDILIRVDVSNKTDGIGVYFLYCYK